MKRTKSSYSILIVRDTGAAPISFKMGAGWVRAIAWLSALFVLSLGAFVYFYGKISARFLTVSAVTAENRMLKARLSELEKLAVDVEKIHALEQKLRALAFKDDKKPAAGIAPKALPQEPLDPAYEKELDDFVQSIKLQRNRGYLKSSDDLKRRKETLASTPNILPVDGWISRGFSESAAADRNGHWGIDIAAAVNTPVRASAPGLVTFSGWKNDWGNMVEIDHGFGFASRYGHCARLVAKKGDLVERSQTVALVGSSGRSTGPHLHFEVIKDGVQVDPLEYVLK